MKAPLRYCNGDKCKALCTRITNARELGITNARELELASILHGYHVCKQLNHINLKNY